MNENSQVIYYTIVKKKLYSQIQQADMIAGIAGWEVQTTELEAPQQLPQMDN